MKRKRYFSSARFSLPALSRRCSCDNASCNLSHKNSCILTHTNNTTSLTASRPSTAPATSSNPSPSYLTKPVPGASSLSSNCVGSHVPDEVLVQILRHVRNASALARLRQVSRRWRAVIEGHGAIWRNVSFKGANFSRCAEVTRSSLSSAISRNGRSGMRLGARAGARAVRIAAAAGNEWARFLERCLFQERPLRALTLSQPVASRVVAGESSLIARECPPLTDTGAWVAIHAARRAHHLANANGANDGKSFPRGAVVGIVHVKGAKRICTTDDDHAWNAGLPGQGLQQNMLQEQQQVVAQQLQQPQNVAQMQMELQHIQQIAAQQNLQQEWTWCIDRAVKLEKPIRCAGFAGVWTTSMYLTEIIIRAMHQQ